MQVVVVRRCRPIFMIFLFVVLLLSGCTQKSESKVYTAIPGKATDIKFLRGATTCPIYSEITRNLYQFKIFVEKNTDGGLLIEIFDSSVLFTDGREELDAIIRGDVDIVFCETSLLVSYVPELEVFDILFHYESIEEVKEEINSNVELIKNSKKHAEDAGFIILALVPVGMRDIATTNSDLILSGDFSGLHIATLPSHQHITAWEKTGATPVPLPYNEFGTAAGEGTINAAEVTLENFKNSSLEEFFPEIFLTQHAVSVRALLFNKEVFEHLPKDQQLHIENAASSFSSHLFETMVKSNEELQKELLSDSNIHYIEGKQKDAFKSAMKL